MKRILVVACAMTLFAVAAVWAQARAQQPPQSETYALLVAYQANLLNPRTRIRDEETGKVEKFASIVDAMNYMHGMASAQGTAYHYLFRRPR